MKLWTRLCLVGALSLISPAAWAAVGPEKISLTAIAKPGDQNFSWLAAPELSFIITSSRTAEASKLVIAFGGQLQTVGQNGFHEKNPWLRDYGVQLKGELRWRFWAPLIETKVFFNHWSFHLLDAKRAHGPEFNAAGIAATLSKQFPVAALHCFVLGQFNLRTIPHSWVRPLAFGLKIGAISFPVNPYFRGLLELGEDLGLKTGEGELGISLPLPTILPPTTTSLDFFLISSFSRQGFSSIRGAIPTETLTPQLGFRLIWAVQ